MRIIFVSNNWDDAHQQTRLSHIEKLSIATVPIGFKRKYYSSNLTKKPYWVGSMEHGSYLKRLKTYLSFSIQISKTVNKEDWIYVYGFDLFIIASLIRIIKGYRIAYEIPDIHESFFKTNRTGKLLRYLEKIFIPKADLIIPTAKEYVASYFNNHRKIYPKGFLTIENKIHVNLNDRPILKLYNREDKIRIGYFGLLRCSASLEFLISLAMTNRYKIILRGIFMPMTSSFEKSIDNTPGITYEGPYLSPQDLKNMYENIDISWVVYPYSSTKVGNHLWARTNRYYESMYFQCPMILQKNTGDYFHTQKLGIPTITIDLKYPKLCSEIIEQKLTREYLESTKKYQKEIPFSDYIIRDEYTQLLTWLQRKK